MKGNLSDPDNLEWLLAWMASSLGDIVEIQRDDALAGLEFRADGEGLRLAWYAFEVLRSGACRQRHAIPEDGWWVGLN